MLEVVQQKTDSDRAPTIAPQEANQPWTAPDFMPGVPILPPSPNYIFTSRTDFEERFPLRAKILRVLEDSAAAGALGQLPVQAISSILRRLNSLILYIDAHNPDAGALLREGQFQAFQSYSRFLENGGSDGYIKLPPRSGKTVLYIALIDALGLQKLKEKCLIVVPSQTLANQTRDRFAEFAPGLKVGIHHSQDKSIKVARKRKTRSNGRRDGSLSF